MHAQFRKSTSPLAQMMALSLALVCSTPARFVHGQPSNYLFNDSHFHLTNYIQEGTDIHDFLKIMGDKAGRVALFGIPLQQQWSYRVDGDRAPTYYLNSDAPLYYYSFTDAWIAMSYKSLSKDEQSRFDPMVTGFTSTLRLQDHHTRRKLTTFSGNFSKRSVTTLHKHFVASKPPRGLPKLQARADGRGRVPLPRAHMPVPHLPREKGRRRHSAA